MVVVAEQEQPAPGVDQPEHQLQRAVAVRSVVGKVAKLHDEAIGRGGVGEGDRIAVHVAHHADAGAGGNGERWQAAGGRPGRYQGR